MGFHGHILWDLVIVEHYEKLLLVDEFLRLCMGSTWFHPSRVSHCGLQLFWHVGLAVSTAGLLAFENGAAHEGPENITPEGVGKVAGSKKMLRTQVGIRKKV